MIRHSNPEAACANARTRPQPKTRLEGNRDRDIVGRNGEYCNLSINRRHVELSESNNGTPTPQRSKANGHPPDKMTWSSPAGVEFRYARLDQMLVGRVGFATNPTALQVEPIIRFIARVIR